MADAPLDSENMNAMAVDLRPAGNSGTELAMADGTTRASHGGPAEYGGPAGHGHAEHEPAGRRGRQDPVDPAAGEHTDHQGGGERGVGRPLDPDWTEGDDRDRVEEQEVELEGGPEL